MPSRHACDKSSSKPTLCIRGDARDFDIMSRPSRSQDEWETIGRSINWGNSRAGESSNLDMDDGASIGERLKGWKRQGEGHI